MERSVTELPTSNTRIADLQDYALYCLIRRMANRIVEECVRVGIPITRDQRASQIEAHRCQTANGILFVTYVGDDARERYALWTPYGLYTFGIGELMSLMEVEGPMTAFVVKCFGAKFCGRRTQPDRKMVSDLYALFRLDDQPLPDPILFSSNVVEPGCVADDLQCSLMVWERFVRRYAAR